ncbi:MAG: SurA N-terminal domain-containing protein [Archangium sp.]|nr:SurA N-terminal domain-containing protein [Archangium sp.]
MRFVLGWLCLASSLAHADAVLVDRVVAVVDARAITRSAVEERAKPLLAVAKTDAAKAQARRDALAELLEEALISKEAQRLRLEVRDEEVDAALGEVAKQNQLTVAELLAETTRQGLDPDRYKGMLKRKILEFKWLGLRVNRAAEPATVAERGAFMVSERKRLMDELRVGAVIEVRP